jgi:hypothetical protein
MMMKNFVIVLNLQDTHSALPQIYWKQMPGNGSVVLATMFVDY